MKRIYYYAVMLFLILTTVSCQKTEMDEIDELMRLSAKHTYPVNESHINHLPETLKNYLRNVGVVGGNYYNNVKFTYKGNFKMNQSADWAAMDAVTYITFEPLSRNWIGEINSSLGIMIGNDYYYNGYGKMDIRLFPSVPFMYSDGYELTISELIAVLAEIVFNPSACLSNKIEWIQVSNYSVKGTLSDASMTVSGTFYFDENYYITHFESNERYFGDSGNIYPWFVFMSDYKTFSGVKVPTTFRGVWQKPEAEFEYINATINDLKFNVNGM